MALPGALHAPVALTPCCLEQAREVEYQRALVAEAAMRSGPAISRHDILFEDEWLLLVNKPSGIYSGHVLASAPSVMGSADSAQLHLANRLDRDTSGVLIISKAKEVSGKLGQLFTKRKMAKSYIGLCNGCLPEWGAITITSGHGRSEFGVYNVFSVSDIGKKLLGRGGSVVKGMKTRFFISTVTREAASSDSACAEQDRLHFCQVPKESLYDRAVHNCKRVGVLTRPPGDVSQQGHDHAEQELVVTGPRSSFQDSLPSAGEIHSGDSHTGLGDKSVYEMEALPKSRKFLFTAFPLTGRTHQIRLQCLYLGIPLLGDVKYGGPHCIDGIKYNAHCLHAGSLSFKHPVTSAHLHVVAPLPPWARSLQLQIFCFENLNPQVVDCSLHHEHEISNEHVLRVVLNILLSQFTHRSRFRRNLAGVVLAMQELRQAGPVPDRTFVPPLVLNQKMDHFDPDESYESPSRGQ